MVLPGDYIYSRQDEFASPIVVEKYKLIFFLVPGIEENMFLRLLRRMMGLDDWQQFNATTTTPSQQGLVHLYDFDVKKASKLMTDSRYTRAIFVGDPKERAFQAFNNSKLKLECCEEGDKVCIQRSSSKYRSPVRP